MTRHELTGDGSTWYWFPGLAEEGEPFAGYWVPQLQCDGYIPAIDGIGFDSEADCQRWIDQAVKASPVPPARVDGVEQAFDRAIIPHGDLSILLTAAAILASLPAADPAHALRDRMGDLLTRYDVHLEVT